MKKNCFLQQISLYLFILVFSTTTPLWAEKERILEFSSTITINEDASLLVREDIRVWAGGNEIKRGIIREFPTDYLDKSGRKIRVGFSIKEILRDGKKEPYHTESMSNGVAIYIGNKDVLLNPGQYSYTIIYKTTGQLGFFSDYDELYWNVNGNGWRLAIDKLSCRVQLPGEAKALNVVSYEGPMGSKDSRRFPADLSNIKISSSRPYAPFEGLTIAISWPKGFIDKKAETSDIIYRYGPGTSLGAALILVFFYYLYFWFKLGRDPAKGTIVPLFNPPRGFSPAMLRFLYLMRFDNTAFTADLINMAVKGALHIKDDKSKKIISIKDTDPDYFSTGEKAIWKILSRTKSPITLNQENHLVWDSAKKAIEYTLESNLKGVYFKNNSLYLLPALALSLLFILLAAYLSSNFIVFVLISLSIMGLNLICFLLLRWIYRSWKETGLWGRIKLIFPFIIMLLPFMIADIIFIFAFYSETCFLNPLFIMGLSFLHLIFSYLLKTPTIEGRKLIDEIEGFRIYLRATEKERLNFLHPPDETPELFERFLPYAIALGIENRWGKRFASILSKAGYEPGWYTGRNFNNSRPGNFASSFSSSMTSSISSASTAPGSSSGSSGGGSSGGGGGGGGGGGW